MAWCHGILFSLFEFGLRGRLPIFIKQFLSDRFSRVRVGSILSEACTLEDGVPQASILSVTLFAVAINSVISVLPDSVHNSLYVDDFFISFSVARMRLIEWKLQLSINKIVRFFLSFFSVVFFVFHILLSFLWFGSGAISPWLLRRLTSNHSLTHSCSEVNTARPQNTAHQRCRHGLSTSDAPGVITASPSVGTVHALRHTSPEGGNSTSYCHGQRQPPSP